MVGAQRGAVCCGLQGLPPAPGPTAHTPVRGPAALCPAGPQSWGGPDRTVAPTPQGPDSHYGTKGLRKVTHESPTTGAKTCFTFCYAAGNNNGTSVEDGQIPEVIFYT